MVLSVLLGLLLPPVWAQSSPKPTRAEEALQRLGSDSPEVRERAFQELRQIGKDGLPTLKAALPRLTDPEVKAQVERLLRILEPPALLALEEYLAASKAEVVALDLWKDPWIEKVLPRTLFFQVWKKGEAGVWKLLGFDEEKKTLFDASQEEAWKESVRGRDEADLDKTRVQISKAASARHASIAAYSGVISSLTLKVEGQGIWVWVKSDGRTLGAFTPEGKAAWTADLGTVLGGGIGAPVIRALMQEGEALSLVFGKHSFAKLDSRSGRVLTHGSD